MNENINCCNDGCECQTNKPQYAPSYSPADVREPAQPDNPNRMKDLVIKQADYGYFVKAGCQTLCIENQENLIALFREYVRNPQRVQELHYSGKLDTVYVDALIDNMKTDRPQEEKQVINIGVVGSSLDDVRDYLSAVIPTAVRTKNSVRKYVLETQDHIMDYYAISSVNHTRAMIFKRVVETHRARDNREFPRIMEAIAITRKTKST